MIEILALAIIAAGPAEHWIPDTPQGADIAPALQAEINECEKDPPIDGNQYVGCIIHIPAGTYRLGRTITLCRQHRVVGMGGGGWGARTVLRASGTAFRLLRDECTGRGKGAAWSELEDFAIMVASTSTTVPSYGVDSESRFTGRNLWIKGPTVGIRVEASQTSGGNANTWRLDGVLVESTDHAGILIRGADSNAGLALGPSVVSACQHASRWESTLGPCAGIVDRSFLGDTWIAAHTNNAGEGTVATRRPGYRFGEDSQRSVCVGCYSESNQAPSVMGRYSNVLSGMADWSGGRGDLGQRIVGPYISSLIARNTKDSANIVEVRMGAIAASGTFLELRSDAIDAARPLRWKADPRRRLYLLDVANMLKLTAWGQGGTILSVPIAPMP